MDDNARAAFERLLLLVRADTGQLRRVANFIRPGGPPTASADSTCPPSSQWIATSPADMATVVQRLAESPVAEYPEACRAEIEHLIRLWRPEAWTRTGETA